MSTLPGSAEMPIFPRPFDYVEFFSLAESSRVVAPRMCRTRFPEPFGWPASIALILH